MTTAPIGALLWDMDGLLVDSEPLWTIAETELSAFYGRTWTPEVKALCMGHRIDEAVPIILTALDLPLDLQLRWEAQLLDRMIELFSTGPSWMPGALELLRTTRLPCALVSSSYRVLVDAVLAHVPAGSFAVSVAGDEVIHAKPHPEPYVKAAQLLGIAPEHCTVLEDSVAGAQSGLAAGCPVVMVPGIHTPQRLPTNVKVLSALTDF